MSPVRENNDWVVQILQDYANAFGLVLMKLGEGMEGEKRRVSFMIQKKGERPELVLATCADFDAESSSWKITAAVDSGSRVKRQPVTTRDLQSAAATGVPLHGRPGEKGRSLFDLQTVKSVLQAYANRFDLKFVTAPRGVGMRGTEIRVDDHDGNTVLYVVSSHNGYEITTEPKWGSKTVSITQIKSAIQRGKMLPFAKNEAVLRKFIFSVLHS